MRGKGNLYQELKAVEKFIPLDGLRCAGDPRKKGESKMYCDVCAKEAEWLRIGKNLKFQFLYVDGGQMICLECRKERMKKDLFVVEMFRVACKDMNQLCDSNLVHVKNGSNSGPVVR